MSVTQWILSEAWDISAGDSGLVLERPVMGTRVEIGGITAEDEARTLDALRSENSLEALRGRLEHFPDEDTETLLDLFLEQQIIRPFAVDALTPSVAGEGRLKEALVSVPGMAAGVLGPALVWQPNFQPPDPRPAQPQLVLSLFEDRLLALLEGSQACRHCMILRTLARIGKRGDLQEELPQAEELIAEHTLRNLIGELLLELRHRPLVDSEALWIEPGGGVRRGVVISHPDCPWCRLPRRSLERAVQGIRRALQVSEGSSRDNGELFRLLVESPFAPISLYEAEGKPGDFPLDLPFITGDVYLTRHWQSATVCASVPNIVYGAGSDNQECRLVALSEGVERLAAGGARPDLWTENAPPAEALPLPDLYSDAMKDDCDRRAYCNALDLVTDKPRLVPYEAVVVSLPEPLYPEAFHRLSGYSGTASHQTLANAVVHATVELLKRDAYMITWYRRRKLPRLTWPSATSELVRRRADYLSENGLDLEVFDLTLQIPLPMVLLRLTARRRIGSWPSGGALLVPAGGFSPIEALEHALGLACGRVVTLRMAPRDVVNPLDSAAVKRLGQQVPYWPLMARYLDPRNRAAHEFLGKSEKSFEALPDPGETSVVGKVERLRAWLREASLPWLVVRLTDQTAETVGFEVAKVVVPGLIGLTSTKEEADFGLPRMNHAWPAATGEELYEEAHPLY